MSDKISIIYSNGIQTNLNHNEQIERVIINDVAVYDVNAKELPETTSETTTLSLSEMERRHIVCVLKLVKGHKGKAAKILAINPKTLYLKMKSYNIVSTYE